jgi:hypothetical protein
MSLDLEYKIRTDGEFKPPSQLSARATAALSEVSVAWAVRISESVARVDLVPGYEEDWD